MKLVGIESGVCKCFGNSLSPRNVVRCLMKCFSKISSVSDVANRIGKNIDEVLKEEDMKEIIKEEKIENILNSFLQKAHGVVRKTGSEEEIKLQDMVIKDKELDQELLRLDLKEDKRLYIEENLREEEGLVLIESLTRYLL